MSTLERTYQKGRAEGLAAGKAEGEASGEVKARAETLLRLLAKRFGLPPADLVARVQGADTAHLDCWTDRILDATSLPDVFAAD